MKNIVIIGSGYVGLVTGASLADLGNRVTCLDINHEKIQSLKEGKVPFFEPGLQELVQRGIESERLFFTDSYENACENAEICFLALPTPSSEDESCNLDYVLAAAKDLAKAMKRQLVIVCKSTVPVGTARKVAEVIEKETTIPFDVISNPEFLREGSAIRDFKQPSRILLGIENDRSEKIMRELYAPFSDKIVVMDIASCELSKYAANAMLAMRLTMMNDLSQLCESLGADIEAIRIALGKDERIGPRYLHPGIGFGGSCLPKDVRALRAISKEVGHDPQLFDSILSVNRRQQEAFLEKIEKYFGSLTGVNLAIWGLSFKPDTDDVREAPALQLAKMLLEKGANLRLYDPVAIENSRPFFREDEVEFSSSCEEAARFSDGVILMTEWKPFQFVSFEDLGKIMHQKVLFDGRNFFDRKKLEDLGFEVFSIGRKNEQRPVFQ